MCSFQNKIRDDSVTLQNREGVSDILAKLRGGQCNLPYFLLKKFLFFIFILWFVGFYLIFFSLLVEILI